jgi:hypothetical protein
VIARFNFKITARALLVIPLKFTGVPITESEKIILMYNTSFWTLINFFFLIKTFLMLRIEPRWAFINGVLLENWSLIFRFQLLPVHNCGECRIDAFPRRKYHCRHNRSFYLILVSDCSAIFSTDHVILCLAVIFCSMNLFPSKELLSVKSRQS